MMRIAAILLGAILLASFLVGVLAVSVTNLPGAVDAGAPLPAR